MVCTPDTALHLRVPVRVTRRAHSTSRVGFCGCVSLFRLYTSAPKFGLCARNPVGALRKGRSLSDDWEEPLPGQKKIQSLANEGQPTYEVALKSMCKGSVVAGKLQYCSDK